MIRKMAARHPTCMHFLFSFSFSFLNDLSLIDECECDESSVCCGVNHHDPHANAIGKNAAEIRKQFQPIDMVVVCRMFFARLPSRYPYIAPSSVTAADFRNRRSVTPKNCFLFCFVYHKTQRRVQPEEMIHGWADFLSDKDDTSSITTIIKVIEHFSNLIII